MRIHSLIAAVPQSHLQLSHRVICSCPTESFAAAPQSHLQLSHRGSLQLSHWGSFAAVPQSHLQLSHWGSFAAVPLRVINSSCVPLRVIYSCHAVNYTQIQQTLHCLLILVYTVYSCKRPRYWQLLLILIHQHVRVDRVNPTMQRLMSHPFKSSYPDLQCVWSEADGRTSRQ